MLVSGDPGLFSLAERGLPGGSAAISCRVIPAVSSLQVAFARLGLDWEDVRMISAHGRLPPGSTRILRRADKLAVPGGREATPSWAASASNGSSSRATPPCSAKT